MMEGAGQGAGPDGEAPDGSLVPAQVTEGILSQIVSCLEDLRSCLGHAPQSFALPSPKTFPTSTKTVAGLDEDSWLSFVRMFRARLVSWWVVGWGGGKGGDGREEYTEGGGRRREGGDACDSGEARAVDGF